MIGYRSQDAQSVVAAATKRCKQLGCRQASIRCCKCFGTKVVRQLRYALWATRAPRETVGGGS
jgi:hypothetical protein